MEPLKHLQGGRKPELGWGLARTRHWSRVEDARNSDSLPNIVQVTLVLLVGTIYSVLVGTMFWLLVGSWYSLLIKVLAYRLRRLQVLEFTSVTGDCTMILKKLR